MRFAMRVLVAAGSMAILLSCGDVPTLASGIAYISAVELPSPVVIAGDTLRDSLGRVAPLRVRAFDANEHEVSGTTTTWFVSPLDTGIHIDAKGVLTANDSIRVVHVVGRVGDRLQTAEALLYVVPKPDQVLGAGITDALVGAPAKGTLQVTVTGTRGAGRSPVRGVVVRYRIVAVNDRPVVDSTRVFLVDDANTPLRNAFTMAVDTTNESGVASRFVTVSDTTGIRKIEISATARSLRGEALSGNPVTFVLPLRKTP
ncbi:hypothetical protein BH11GEM1_BH11GEM1_03310 [soil metagenome]